MTEFLLRRGSTDEGCEDRAAENAIENGNGIENNGPFGREFTQFVALWRTS